MAAEEEKQKRRLYEERQKEEQRLAEERAAAIRAKLQKIAGISLGSVLLLVAVLVLVYLLYVKPYEKYDKAKELAANGQYREAIAAFRSLGSFLDSEELLLETREKQCSLDYAKTEACLEEKNYADAYRGFLLLFNYRDSAEKRKEILETLAANRYAEAERFLLKKDYLAAFSVFQSLGGYRDCLERKEELRQLYYEEVYDGDYGTYAQPAQCPAVSGEGDSGGSPRAVGRVCEGAEP